VGGEGPALPAGPHALREWLKRSVTSLLRAARGARRGSQKVARHGPMVPAAMSSTRRQEHPFDFKILLKLGSLISGDIGYVKSHDKGLHQAPSFFSLDEHHARSFAKRVKPNAGHVLDARIIKR
jgi:hypothetical protein